MSRSLGLVALALLVSVASLPAQDSTATVVPGQTIRIQVLGGGGTQGTLTAIDADRLWIAVNGADTVTVARADVARIDVYQGMKSRVGKNALTGGLIGAGVGALLGAASAAASEGTLVEYSAGAGAASGALTFGVIGAGIGALTGISKRPVWKTVSLPTVTVAPASSDGEGVAIGLHFRF